MLSFTVDGATISVGVQKSEIDQRLFRNFLYRKFAELDSDLKGEVGTTIAFSQEWEPATTTPGITDVVALPLRDPILAQRNITLLTYGEGREFSKSAIKRSQAKLEKCLRKGLPDSVARSINQAWGNQMRATNVVYTPTGIPGAETNAMLYTGIPGVPAGTMSRLLDNWDFAQLQVEAGLLGIPPHDTFGYCLVCEPRNIGGILLAMQASALAGPPEAYKKAMEMFAPDKYIGWLHGTTIFYDNTQDVLSSAVVGAGPGPYGEALFFGRNPLVEAAVNEGPTLYDKTSSADGRILRIYYYEEDIGCTLAVNDAGLGAVPPATFSSTCCIVIADQ